jgi:hypothetical protein
MLKNAIALALCLSVLSGATQARSSKVDKTLDANLRAYALAVRWNDFNAASTFIDPELRTPEGFTEADENYYKRFQISGYALKSAMRPDAQTYNQRVELRIIDVDYQTERTLTDRQSWRYDATTKRWWLTSGLPKLD